ncbi:MAG: hypothetical protein FWH00_03470 [Oscillospiraceae bacterium]|nr:hypothetical protein [Oscillospiraceae bacterium]
MSERNPNCPCTSNCPRHGDCKACQANHEASGNLTACRRAKEADKK